MSDSTPQSPSAPATSSRVQFLEYIEIFDIPGREPSSPPPPSPTLDLDPPEMDTEDLLEDTLACIGKLQYEMHCLGLSIAPLCPDSDLTYFHDVDDAVMMEDDEFLAGDPADWGLTSVEPEALEAFVDGLIRLGTAFNRLGCRGSFGEIKQLDEDKDSLEEELKRGVPENPEVAAVYMSGLRLRLTMVREFVQGVQEQVSELAEEAERLEGVLSSFGEDEDEGEGEGEASL